MVWELGRWPFRERVLDSEKPVPRARGSMYSRNSKEAIVAATELTMDRESQKDHRR